MPKKQGDLVFEAREQVGELDERSNGTSAVQSARPEAGALGFTREALLEMQSDRDLAPSLAEADEEESYIPLGKPGKVYITIHPDPAYEPTIPAKPAGPITTRSAALAFRKQRCENTP
jgi:hypothetical protein